MTYSIFGFDQETLVKLGLDCTEAAILRWFVDFQSTGKMRILESPMSWDLKRYHWVKYQAVIDDLPCLGITNKQVIARHLKHLCSAEVLEFHMFKRKGTYTCFRTGPKYCSLVERSQPKSTEELTQKLIGVDSKVDTKDSSINPSIKHKDCAKPKRRWKGVGFDEEIIL
jgi:hypothetical protein